MTRIPDPLVRHEWWFELMYIDDYRWRNDFADDLMMPNMALGVKMNICAAALMTTHVIQRVDRWKSWVACFSCLYLVIDQRSCFTVVLYSSLIHTQYNWPVNKFWLDWLDTHVQSKMFFFYLGVRPFWTRFTQGFEVVRSTDDWVHTTFPHSTLQSYQHK